MGDIILEIMVNPLENNRKNKVETHILKQRAQGIQGQLIDPTQVFIPENVVRHEEVWNSNVEYLIPGEKRIRYNKFKGDLT